MLPNYNIVKVIMCSFLLIKNSTYKATHAIKWTNGKEPHERLTFEDVGLMGVTYFSNACCEIASMFVAVLAAITKCIQMYHGFS